MLPLTKGQHYLAEGVPQLEGDCCMVLQRKANPCVRPHLKPRPALLGGVLIRICVCMRVCVHLQNISKTTKPINFIFSSA